MMFWSGFRIVGAVVTLFLATTLIPDAGHAQRPPSEGTGGAAGYSPPPLDMPRSIEPMNAPPAPADAVPADTVPEPDAAPAQAAPEPDAAPGADIPDEGGSQPPEENTGADQPD
ncbi:MAG TPA: hypothetical protein VH852_07705 [Hyphomicrobium sp.]